MTESPIIKPHPLDHPGSIKIRLSLAASQAIEANGDYHLAIISHPDCTSPPECAGRMILSCLPLPLATLNEAISVGMGQATVRRIKKPTRATPPA
jgi:hypothetical protein